MPQALPAAAAWATAAWTSAVTATAGTLAAVGTVAAIGEGATIALAGAIVQTGATLAISAASAALLRPDVPSSGSTLDFKPDPKAPVRGGMGYGAVGGNKVFQATWGYNRVAMSLGVALSLGPIDQITQFRADDAVVSFGGSQNEATGFYGADMWQRVTMGLPTDAALLPPTGLKYGNPGLTGWNSTNAAPGTAFAFWTMVLAKNPEDRDIFNNGVPDPRWIGRWMRVWDPRKDDTYPGGVGPQRRDDWRTWAWSENPYVHALAWVRGHYKMNVDGSLDPTRRIAGIGAPDGAIDMPAFVEGMNVADTNHWTISGQWSTSDGKFQTLISMLQAGSGEPISRGAQISVMVNAPRVATYTYTRDDLIGSGEVRPLTPRRDRKNTITPRYRSEAHGWEYVPAGEVTSQVYRDEDRGEPRSLEIEYVHVRDAKQAGQLAAYDLANMREGLTATLPSKVHLMHVHPGDCITVDVPELALANQKFIVRRASTNYQAASVTLELRSATEAHAWALGQAANPPPSPSLSAVDPRYVAPPVSLDWTIVPRPPGGDGTEQPVVVVAGEVGTGDVARVIIEFGRTTDGPWTLAYSGSPMADGRYIIAGMEPNTDYWVSVRYVARNGTVSDRMVTGPVTTGGLIAGGLSPDSPSWDQIAQLISDEGAASIAIAEAEQRMADALAAAETRLDGAIDALGLEDLEGFTNFETTTQTALDGKASNTELDALQTQTDNLLGRIVTAEETLTDIPNQVASSSAVQALESELAGARDGAASLNARLLSDRQTVVNGLAGKASTSEFSELSAEVEDARGTATSLNQRLDTVQSDINGKATSQSVSTLSSEITTARGGLPTLSAKLTNIQTTLSDSIAQKASSSSVTDLSSSIGDLSSELAVVSETAVDAQDRLSTASFEVLAAAGGAPARLAIKANETGSAIAMAATSLVLTNTTSTGSVEALKLVEGLATFGAPISSVSGGNRLTIGPGFGAGAQTTLWFGSEAVAYTQMSRANAKFSLGTDGQIYLGGQLLDDVVNQQGYAASFAKINFGAPLSPTLVASSATIATQASETSPTGWGRFTPGSSGSPFLEWALARPGEKAYVVRLRIKPLATITAAQWRGDMTFQTASSPHTLLTGLKATAPFPFNGLPAGKWRTIEFDASNLTDFQSQFIQELRFYFLFAGAPAVDIGWMEVGYRAGATANSGALADLDTVSLDTHVTDGTSFKRYQAVEQSKLGGITTGATRNTGALADQDYVSSVYIPDTRDDNQPPSYYYALGRGVYPEFKNRGAIGAPGSGTYAGLSTMVQYQTTSGGPVTQTVTTTAGTFYRQSTNTTTWGGWIKSYDQINKPNLDDDIVEGSTYKRFLNTEKSKLTGIDTAATRNTGALADLNVIDLASNFVTGKDLYNIDPGQNAKLIGIATAATRNTGALADANFLFAGRSQLGRTDNGYPDPDFLDLDYNNYDGYSSPYANSFAIVTNPGDTPGKNAVRLGDGGVQASSYGYLGHPFQVLQNGLYRMGAAGGSYGNTSNATAALYVAWYSDAACTVAASVALTTLWTDGTTGGRDVLKDLTVKAPPNAIRARFLFYRVGHPTVTDRVVFSTPFVKDIAVDSRMAGKGLAANALTTISPNPPLTATISSGARINVLAFTLKGDFGTLSYGAATISGLAYDTTYYVFAVDPIFEGGTVTYVATTSLSTYVSSKDHLYLGAKRTLTSGGGVGGGGTAPDPCVHVDMVMHDGRTALNVKAGDPLLMLGDDRQSAYLGEVEGVRLGSARCYHLVTAGGAQIVVSEKTPLTAQDGSVVRAQDVQPGYLVATRYAGMAEDQVRWEPLVKITDVGEKIVKMISANDGIYAAGMSSDALIFTHNIQWKPA